MVLYLSQHRAELAGYGIDVPAYTGTVDRVIGELLADEALAQRREQWLRTELEYDIGKSDLLRVHDPRYVERLYSSAVIDELIAAFELIDSEGRYHRYAPERAELPLADLFLDLLGACAGTYQSSRVALEHGFCYFLGGGFHHAKWNTPDGFCLINDIVIAARRLLSEELASRVWIIDLDAHKGDGTAPLCRSDDRILTLSIHMAHGWPLDREPRLPDGSLHESFVASDLDIPVAEGEERLYLEKLQLGLAKFSGYGAPDLALVLGGVDPYEHDELPSTAPLRLSLEQLEQRDRFVYGFLKERAIPQAWVKSGSYGREAWRPIVQFLRYALHDRLGSR